MINANSHFATLPAVNIERSKVRVPFRHKTTFNASDLIPAYWSEILPGTTVSMDQSVLIRMTTPVFPVMDDAFADFFWFYVPSRLLWSHWQEFLGENNSTYWEQPIQYQVPQVTAPEGGWQKGTIADYMGVPTKIENFSMSVLPFRAYAKIYNDWFRDENLKQPCNLSLDETTRQGSNGNNYIIDCELGGMPAKAAKFHDFFTSALPAAQKGDPAAFNITGGDVPVNGVANVVGNGKSLGLTDGDGKLFGLYQTSGGLSAATGNYNIALPVTSVGGSTASSSVVLGVTDKVGESGMVADMTGVTVNIGNIGRLTINELREAFAVQRFLELQARSGSRYVEILRSSFGVTCPDARLQRAEFLGSTRININMESVVQTSSSSNTPQGNVSGYSVSGDYSHAFTHSFVEHGYLFCMCVVRNLNTYQQGLEEAWQRKDKLDFYWKNFAHIGEQPVKNKTIFLQSDSVLGEDGVTPVNDETFGFQEAWASYRSVVSRCSGLFRSNVDGSLDSWHYADYYTDLPVLSGDWIDSSMNNINRTLAVQNEDQFFADFSFPSVKVLPMPLYSIPGLLDHF